MAKGALPGFAWDKKQGVYRRIGANGTVGAVVARDEIISVLDTLDKRSTKLLGDLLVALDEGLLLESDAYLAGRLLLKDLYNATAALAVGGWQGLTPAIWGRGGQILRGEYQFFKALCADIAAGQLSEAQIWARAALYIGKAYSRFWAEDRLLKLASNAYQWEQWLDRDGPHECDDCHALAALGRVPLGSIGTVPGAGATACGGNCLCILSYS